MNPWNFLLIVLGWGVLAIIAILAVGVIILLIIALAAAIRDARKKRPRTAQILGKDSSR